MQYILTSVGLSSITNGLKDVFSPKEIYENSNKQKDEIDKKFLEKFEIGFDKLKNKILSHNYYLYILVALEIDLLLNLQVPYENLLTYQFLNLFVHIC